MSEGKIIAEKDGYVGRVIFDNVAKHNAVSRAMWDSLADTVEAYETDEDVRVIVLEGAGTKAFVSGADISQFDDEHANVDAVKAYGTSVARGYGAVQHAKKPTIAKIRGYCYGGGAGIAICTDIRICSDNSSFFAFPRRSWASDMDPITPRSWLISWDRPLRRRSSIRGAGSMRRKRA